MDLNTAPAAMRFNRRTSRPNMQHFPQQRNHRVESGLNLSFPKQRHTELLWFGHLHWHRVSVSLCFFQSKCDSTLYVFFAHRASRGTPSIFDWDRGAKVEAEESEFLGLFRGRTALAPLQDAVKSNVSLSSSRCPRPRAAQQGFPCILRSTPLWARLCTQAQTARVFAWAFPLRVPWTPLESRRRGTLPRAFQFTCLTATWSGSQSGNRDRWCR